MCISLVASSQTCPSGYEPINSDLAVSKNGKFDAQGGAIGGGLLNTDDPATKVGTYNETTMFWSQARRYNNDTYANPSNHNMYSLMTKSYPANTFFTGSLIEVFPGDPEYNVEPTNTYYYSNGNIFYGKEYVLWGQEIDNLVVGWSYTFSTYVNNAIEPPFNAEDDPIITLKMGGHPGLPNGDIVAGPITFTEEMTSTNKPLKGWVRIAHTFTATSTSAVFKITSKANGPNGDDYQMAQVQIVACGPALNLSYNTVCASQTLQLQANVSVPGSYTYAWTGPNGFTSTQQNPEIPNANLSNSGLYTCIISDNSGIINKRSIMVTIKDCMKDDVNAGLVYTSIPGNVNTNDVVPTGTIYGEPVASSINPPGGVINMSSDGRYNFTATTPGVYTYTVPVYLDGITSGYSTTELVITIKDVLKSTNLPVANTDFAITPFETSVTVNILANDGVGNDNGTLGTPTIINGVNNGASAVITNNNLVYTPAPGFIGKDTVYYKICETPSGLCAQSKAIITVLPLDAPNTTSASDDYALTQVAVPVSGNVKNNDIDAEGNTITVIAQNINLTEGQFVLEANGSYTFTPAEGFVGTVDLPYEIYDNGNPSASAKATLHIVVYDQNTVPVNLQVFDIEQKNQSVQLTWITATEQNNKGFEVERKVNEGSWLKIGFVQSLSQTGTSTQPLKYNYIDNKLTNEGNVYYRLKQVDLNDKYKYSEVKLIIFNSSNNKLALYPNPAKNTIQVSGYGLGIIYDMSGRKVIQKNINGKTSIDISNLASGMYIFKLGGEIIKFIKS